MKRHHERQFFCMMIAGTTALSLAACGGANKEAGGRSGYEKQAAAAESTDIKGNIVVGGWPTGDDGLRAALDGFHKVYPNIEVEFQFTDTTSHHQALATSLAAGSGAPDVAMVEGAYIAQYRDSRALTNLLEQPYDAERYKDDFVALKWDQAYSVDKSRFVAVPWDVGPCTYFYRTDVFRECGLPTDPDEVAKLMSTWDGVLKVAEAVYKPGERWLVPSATYFYQLMFCNRDYYDENMNLKLDRDGDLNCLNAIIKMRKNKWDMNVDMWSPEAYAAYADGTCVSVATGGWFGGLLKVDIDPEGAGHWGVAELPGGIAHCNWGGSFMVIPEQSKNKEAAWAFIEYMLCTSEAQNLFLQTIDFFPAYTPAYGEKALYEETDPYFGGKKTKALWADISKDLDPVFNTIMDVTAEGCIYSSVNAGLEQGLDSQGLKDLLARDIDNATKELRNQQIQVYKDAGLWKE